jgi:hypothetical protein
MLWHIFVSNAGCLLRATDVASWNYFYIYIYIYTHTHRIIHKSLQDFQPLWYSSQNGDTEGEHVNRGRDIASFCPALQVLNMTNVYCTRSTVSADGPCQPVRFAAHSQPLCCNFMYHSRIVLSAGGSVWYTLRNIHCTITIDSVLANSKTQNPFLFPLHAMFCHNCLLVVKPASKPRHLVCTKTWRDSLPIDMLLSAVSVLVLTQQSSEVLEGFMNYPVCVCMKIRITLQHNNCRYTVGMGILSDHC